MCVRSRREGIQPWIGDGRLHREGVAVAAIRYRIQRVVDVRYTTVDGRICRQEGQATAIGTYVVRRGNAPSGVDGIVLELCDGRRAPVSIDGNHLQIIGEVVG